MPKIAYKEHRFSEELQQIILRADSIIEEYQDKGYVLTLRQLYYQFVARGILPNTVQSYKRLGSVINDARLAGMIDWRSIEDRTRSTVIPPSWSSPASIIRSAASGYQIDKWSDQPHRVEVWIEKEALAGVISGVCEELNIPYLSCRGYTSQSEMWSSARRLLVLEANGQETLILHLGDHDPSGIDMTRDIEDRLAMFGSSVSVKRIALNMDQIEEYDPPPNPAKTTDARYSSYMDRFGSESWELDALNPEVLTSLVRQEVLAVLDGDLWSEMESRENRERQLLHQVAEKWDEIAERIEDEEEDG